MLKETSPFGISFKEEKSTEVLSYIETSSFSNNRSSSSYVPRWETGPPVSSHGGNDTFYPEGGLRAWLVVLGGLCGMMAAFGFMNIIGIIQQYLRNNELKEYSDASVGWIFSIFIFLSLFGGIQVGPIFDSHGPKWLIIAGGFLVSASAFLLGSCTRKHIERIKRTYLTLLKSIGTS
jgi:hypothetical protein